MLDATLSGEGMDATLKDMHIVYLCCGMKGFHKVVRSNQEISPELLLVREVP